MDKSQLYIHEISIVSSSVKVEDDVKKMLAALYIDRQRGIEDSKDDLDIKDINVKIGERRISFRCHNGWTFVGKKRS